MIINKLLHLTILTTISLHASEILSPVTIKATPIYPMVIDINEEFQINHQTLSKKLFNEVTINQTTDSSNGNIISIRGNNFRATDYYEDGIPLYRTSNGYVDLSMYTAESSDLSLNAGGALGIYGPSATGGAIILTSKKMNNGLNGSVKTSLSTNENFFNTLVSYKDRDFYINSQLNIIKQNRFKISNDFAKTLIQPTNKRVNSDSEHKDAYVKVGYKVDNNNDIAFKVSRLINEFGNPTRAYGEQNWDQFSRVNNKELNSYWFFHDYTDNKFKITNRAYYDDYQDTWNIYNDSSFTTHWPSVTYFDSRIGAISSLQYEYTNKQNGTLSFQIEKNRHKSVEVGDLVVKINEVIDSSFSYLHQYKVSQDLSIGAAIKYKKQSLTKAHNFSDNDINYKDNDEFDVQLTFDYTLNNRQSFYGSVARKNRFASLRELYPYFPWDTANTNVLPEKSNSAELGTSYIFNNETTIELTTFYNKIDNMIINQNNIFTNIEKATLKGFEARLYSMAFTNQQIELSYAYTDAVDNAGVRIVEIPKSKLYLQDNIEITSKLNFLASLLFVSDRDDIYNSNTFSLTSYTLVDSQLSYQSSNNLSFKGGVKNIFDRNWEYKYAQPAIGRSLFVSMKYDF